MPDSEDELRKRIEAWVRERAPEEIHRDCSLLRERVRQIEDEALRQLRSPERARCLRALLAERLGYAGS